AALLREPEDRAGEVLAARTVEPLRAHDARARRMRLARGDFARELRAPVRRQRARRIVLAVRPRRGAVEHEIGADEDERDRALRALHGEHAARFLVGAARVALL